MCGWDLIPVALEVRTDSGRDLLRSAVGGRSQRPSLLTSVTHVVVSPTDVEACLGGLVLLWGGAGVRSVEVLEGVAPAPHAPLNPSILSS